MLISVPPQDIIAGDTFYCGGPVWTALEDARHTSNERGRVVQIDVQHHPDGGCATREWPDGTLVPLTVERDDSA